METTVLSVVGLSDAQAYAVEQLIALEDKPEEYLLRAFDLADKGRYEAAARRYEGAARLFAGLSDLAGDAGLPIEVTRLNRCATVARSMAADCLRDAPDIEIES